MESQLSFNNSAGCSPEDQEWVQDDFLENPPEYTDNAGLSNFLFVQPSKPGSLFFSS
jgi:hypothetical protein